jgi:hypothetical protein
MSFPKVVWQLGPLLLERKKTQTLWAGPYSVYTGFWCSFAGLGESGGGVGEKWLCN